MIDTLEQHLAKRSRVEQGVDVRTMMSLGGWSSYAAVEPYLGEPTEAKIGRVLSP